MERKIVENEKKQETIAETASEKEVKFTDTSATPEEPKEESKEKEVTYTQEQVDEIVKSRLAREKKRQEKKETEVKDVTPTETETNEVIEKAKEPTKQLSEREQKILAEHFANEQYAEIEKLGLREMEYEANRLANMKRNATDDILFMKLGKTLKNNADKLELEKQGIESSILNDSEFKEFTNKLSNSLSITEKYDMFAKVTGKEKKEPDTIGSVKNEAKISTELKEFYTMAEIKKFTRKDYEANPELMKKVEKSLQAKKQ